MIRPDLRQVFVQVRSPFDRNSILVIFRARLSGRIHLLEYFSAADVFCSEIPREVDSLRNWFASERVSLIHTASTTKRVFFKSEKGQCLVFQRVSV